MSKRKSLPLSPQPVPEAPSDGLHHHLPSSAAVREAVESIVIALILAFLFRTFEAEAFVIPTGSMAPTLMGRHKDVVCPQCGCPYQVSASDEVDLNGNLKGQTYQVEAGTCPMCRYTADLGPHNPQHQSYPSYNGDRILVGKFVYQFSDPERWDVIVFKFPGDEHTDSRTNFIKRLIGLPGETVRIQHGNIWIRPNQENEAEFSIARKSPEKLLAVLQPVFDNDCMPPIAERGWPVRWRPESPSTAGAWTSDDKKTFRADGSADGENWLRYQHLIPSYGQWKALERGEESITREVEPQWITDFTAYNTGREPGDRHPLFPMPPPDSLGLFWVGDLALSCTVDLESDKGQLVFELRKGGRRFQCHIEAATGKATLSVSGPGMEPFQPSALTNVRGPGQHEIRFSNCDNELLLWVDGSVVSFDASTRYGDLGNTLPDATDKKPVGVASVGAAVQISHLAIFRDLYYITNMQSNRQASAAPNELFLRHRAEGYSDFMLADDQFFVLGDNSARSKDGRLWGSDNYWVGRELLIGKALFIYWPHSWDKIRTPWFDIPFPYFPNFARMRLVR